MKTDPRNDPRVTRTLEGYVGPPDIMREVARVELEEHAAALERGRLEREANKPPPDDLVPDLDDYDNL